MNKKRTFCITLVIVIMVLLWCFRSCGNSDTLPEVPVETEPKKTLDFSPVDGNTENNITIPGVTGICMEPNQTEQTVHFYNPEKNNCLFVISLYLSDGTLIFQSKYISPGEQLTDIALLTQLEQGIYKNCCLLYECYSLDGLTQYNGSQFTIEINTT